MVKPSRFDWFFRPHMPDEDRPLSAELRFAEALAELPAIERSALALSEIGGLGTDEIAQRLGTDVAVVRKVLARARETVRTTIAARGRRSLTALIPFQNWWSNGSAAPAVRTAGAVAAAVLGTGVAIGGAATDPPRPPLVSPDPPSVRALDAPQDRSSPLRHAGRDATLSQQPEQSQQRQEGSSGPAAVRPEGEGYGDIGARPGATAARPPYAPARRADEPDLGVRATPPPASQPALPADPVPAEPVQPTVTPPPPLPFPTPYPAPVPVPVPAPVPVPVQVPASVPTPVPLPPLDPPVETPTPPAAPALPSLP